MSDALSFEFDGQHAELLPARTVLSIGVLGNVLGNAGGDGGGASASGEAISQSGDAQLVQKPTGGDGGGAQGGGILGGVLGVNA